MLKFVVLGAFLCQQIIGNGAAPTSGVPTDDTPVVDDTKLLADPNAIHNLHLAQQMFYLNSPLLWSNQVALVGNPNAIGKQLPVDYTVSKGIGAHKLHLRKLPWNRARRICQEEGGHLAIIRTESEEKIILQMLLEDSLEDAWIGFHDKFEEGDWISVLDEPLGQTGWARWSKKFSPNPENKDGKQHCARIVKNGGGMDDATCEIARPFVCKISIV